MAASRIEDSLTEMRPTSCFGTKAGLLCAALVLGAYGQSTNEDHVYTSGFSTVIKLSSDLHDALEQKFTDRVDAQVISLQPLDMPVITPVAVNADNHLARQVEISAGFIDLINHLAHAKAIDKVEPGYFDRYVGILARSGATDPAAPGPPIVEARFWTQEILDDQLAYFNQMMAAMPAINMAHHYMGHYTKYASKLAVADQKTTSINSFLTQQEWDIALKAGALNALNCALSTEGLRVLFEALEKMPTRPAWAIYLAPEKADFKKLNKLMAKLDDDFFHGRIKN